MKLFFALLVLTAVCFAAPDAATAAANLDAATAAANLAKEAQKSENAGQVVRAYLLYVAAAARDPRTPAYAIKREALEPSARMLMKAKVENASPKTQQPNPRANTIESASLNGVLKSQSLEAPPHISHNGSIHNFDLRVDEKTAIAQVAKAYGIEAIFDPEFDSRPLSHFQLDQADFLTAMDALTQVTGTFVFPLTPRSIFVSRDTQMKREQFEPVVVLTVSVPNSTEPVEVLEVATAIRGALSLRAITWDSVSRTLVIRDRVTRARIAASLVEAVILPKAQINVEVQIVALDTNVGYHYGTALPTSFPSFDFAHIGAFKSNFPDVTNVGALLALGSGSNFFGLAIGNATLFATYNKSSSRVLYDTTIAVSEGKTATLHVGDKYPIPTSLYSGFQQSNSSIYNPIGQVTQEDLGILIKVGAHAHGDGDISLDLEAAYKALGATTLNTVPAIAQREFKGSVRLRQDEYAIIAGMDSNQRSSSRSGLAGIADIPGINQFLAENNRTHTTSDTLILVKPTITRLPMSDLISPQYLLGPQHGTRVLM